MLTVKQAAGRAGVSESLVRRWVAAGRLAHYRPGGAGRRGKVLIAEVDLDALLASFRVEALLADGSTEVRAPATHKRPRRTPLKHLRA